MLTQTDKDKLVQIGSTLDIPQAWAGTPIEKFIQAQNFNYPLTPQEKPQLAICTCIDYRIYLRVPAHYAYVLRTAGGRIMGGEFALGYILARGVNHLLLIAHNDCGMTKIPHYRTAVIEAFVDQGWSRKGAEQFVDSSAGKFAMESEMHGLEQEYLRLKHLLKGMYIAPLFLDLHDGHVHLPKWFHETLASKATSDTGAVQDKEIQALP